MIDLNRDQPDYMAVSDAFRPDILKSCAALEWDEVEEWWIEDEPGNRDLINAALECQRQAQHRSLVESQRWY